MMHKCQKLTLRKMMLNFYHKNNFIKQNYITLFRVHFIDYVTFKFEFLYDHFFSRLSIDAKNKITNTFKKNDEQNFIFMTIQVSITLINSNLISITLTLIHIS